MGYQRNMLLRTSLSDVGDLKGHGSYYSSPDMIAHPLVNNPQDEFGSEASYKKDPSQSLDQSSRTNTIYTRVKSMQEAAGTVTGYIRMYRANASLFMNTDLWKDNKLFTPKGKDYVKVVTQNNGDIVVGDDVFTVDGTKPNFCMVGIVNDSTEEELPKNFSNISDFIVWVHSERCVAVRNFTYLSSGILNDYESLYSISNPENKSRLGALELKISGLPEGTIFGMSNEALQVNKSSTYDPDDSSTETITDAFMMEAGYEGYIEVYARLPKGTVWPPNASLITTFWVAALAQEEMIQFAVPAENILLETNVLNSFRQQSSTGVLVKAGECAVMFV